MTENDEVTRVAVVGAGAIGATVAAWLSENPAVEVVICNRTPFEVLRVEAPDVILESRPQLFADPSTAPEADWVVVATKTYDAEGAAQWFERLVTPKSFVAVLQNGVEHMSRFPGLAPTQLVPVIVDIPAERSEPGKVVQRSNGSMLVPATEPGAAFVRLFEHSPIDVQTTTDWLTAAWRKLAINCAGAVNALAMVPAKLAWDHEIAELMQALVRECVAVGRAEGAQLSDNLPEEVVEHYRRSAPDSINSIHADRLAGRPTEAAARNGVIARLGARHGIEAPLNAMADIILRASSPPDQSR